MTAAAAAALTQTSQVLSGPEAKVPMMATPSGSLQPNWQLHFQAPLKDASTVDASASKAATAAAAMPLSTPLPSMPMQTTGKLLLPATAVLLPVKSMQATLPAPASQQEGTATVAAAAAAALQEGAAAAEALHLPSARLPSLYISATASPEIPAGLSPGTHPAAGASSPLRPAHAPQSSPSGFQHPQATLLSEQSQSFQTSGMSQTPHAQASARPTCAMLVPPTQTAGFQSFFTQPQKVSPLYAEMPNRVSTSSTSVAAGAAAAAVPNQLPPAPAELPSSDTARGTSARVCLPPLQGPPPAVLPNPPMCATEAQGTAAASVPEPRPAAAMPTLETPPQAILANPSLQAHIMSAAPAIPNAVRDSALKEGSAELPARVSPSSANVAMPVCIAQVVHRVNGLMGPQQHMHHITEAQAAHLDEVFGDVEVLLDLASMDDKPLNRALRCDGKLIAVQIVSMRGLLRTISIKSSA